MQPTKVHCLFEQSGTFKNAFKKIGIPAFDYDIENLFNHVDKKIDIFVEISRAKNGFSSIFSKIKYNELVLAFFPCTYFSDQIQMCSRGDNANFKDWTLEEKLVYSQTQMVARTNYYNYLCELCIIAFKYNFPLIVENPAGTCGFLNQYFPIKNKIICRDRRKLGDKYKKPTAFYFVNCCPTFHLQSDFDVGKKIPRVESDSGFTRSEITPQFAENFIKTFILE